MKLENLKQVELRKGLNQTNRLFMTTVILKFIHMLLIFGKLNLIVPKSLLVRIWSFIAQSVVQNVKKITISSVHTAEQNTNNKLITRSLKGLQFVTLFY
jgi:hypothetical protein